MLWVQRLNAPSSSLDLGEDGGRAQILSWNYAAQLPDNLPHRHTFFEVCTLGERGHGEFRVENCAHEIQSGDTFFARPGVIHQIVNGALPNMELFWLCFSLDGGRELSRGFAQSEIVVARDERIGAIWNALASAATSSVAGSSDVVSALSKALLGAILGAGSDLPAEDAPPAPDFRAHQARLAVRFVHDNLSRPLSLGEIASHVHISTRQLARLFAQFTGTSPAQYIERARLDRAEALLLKSSLSLKAVAREVGYEDAAHFSRVFSKRNGNPPGDFRKRGAPLITKPGGANIQRLGELV